MKSIILTNFILIVIPKLTYYFLKSILYCFGGYLPNLLIVYHVITEIYYRKLYSLLFRLSTDAFGTAGRWRIRCDISYHSFLGDFYFESFNTLPFTPDLPEFLKSHIPCISMPPWISEAWLHLHMKSWIVRYWKLYLSTKVYNILFAFKKLYIELFEAIMHWRQKCVQR